MPTTSALGSDVACYAAVGGNGDKFTAMLAQLEVANEKLNRKVELDYTWDPSEYRGLCYKGTVSNRKVYRASTSSR